MDWPYRGNERAWVLENKVAASHTELDLMLETALAYLGNTNVNCAL